MRFHHFVELLVVAVCVALLMPSSAFAASGFQNGSVDEEQNSSESSVKEAGGENHSDGESHSAEEGSHGSDHGSHGGGHGEPHDLTHGAASDAMEQATEIRLDKTLFTLIVFGLMSLVLYTQVWPKIVSGLQAREEGIAKNIADAETASVEANKLLADYQAKLDEAHTEAQGIVAQARKDAEAASQRIVAEAQEEAARNRDRALAEIESAKQTALSEISGKSTDLAFGMARSIVGRELKQDDHKSLVNQALSSLNKNN